MPNLVEDLWSAFNKKHYDEVKAIINDHPEKDLKNSVDPIWGTLLKAAFFSKPYPKKFIEFILTDLQFNLAYENTATKVNNIETLIRCGDLEDVQTALKHPGIYANPNTLAYEIADKLLAVSEKSYQRQLKKDPSGTLEATITAKAELECSKLKLAHIRDASIRYALDNDRDDIFEGLERAGTDPTDYLLDGTLPGMMMDRVKCPKICAWCDRSAAKIAARLSTNIHSHLNNATKLNDAAKQKQALERQMNGEITAVLSDGVTHLSTMTKQMSI
ncbi:MAG: hypothetical protein WC627_01490 [Legionella sp.]|jgi:hypothetical protein